MPIDVGRDGVDAPVAGGYNGFLGPFGTTIFYLREELVGKTDSQSGRLEKYADTL